MVGTPASSCNFVQCNFGSRVLAFTPGDGIDRLPYLEGYGHDVVKPCCTFRRRHPVDSPADVRSEWNGRVATDARRHSASQRHGRGTEAGVKTPQAGPSRGCPQPQGRRKLANPGTGCTELGCREACQACQACRHDEQLRRRLPRASRRATSPGSAAAPRAACTRPHAATSATTRATTSARKPDASPAGDQVRPRRIAAAWRWRRAGAEVAAAARVLFLRSNDSRLPAEVMAERVTRDTFFSHGPT